MNLCAESLEELRAVCETVEPFVELGLNYVHLQTVPLPDAVPREGILCLSGRDGYPSRLFLSQPVPGRGTNWSVHHIRDRAWHTWSWSGVPADLRPVEVLASHLDAFR